MKILTKNIHSKLQVNGDFGVKKQENLIEVTKETHLSGFLKLLLHKRRQKPNPLNVLIC